MASLRLLPRLVSRSSASVRPSLLRLGAATPSLSPLAASPQPCQQRGKSKKAAGKHKPVPAGEAGPEGAREMGAEGEAFDAAAIAEHMKRAVGRAKEAVGAAVGAYGRVDAALLDSVRVQTDAKDKTLYALRDVASVGVREGALLVTCFEAEMTKAVERAIYVADLGLTPQATNEEGVLRVAVPRPTAETRANLQKDVARLCENARVAVRTARHTAQKQIKSDEKRKIVGTAEGAKDLKKVEEETKKRTAEIDAFFEATKKKIEQGA